MSKPPHTLDQLPLTAREYYALSAPHKDAPGSALLLFQFELVGRDDAGRMVFQKYFQGEPWGQPQALLRYREYSEKAQRVAREIGPSVGVLRWTAPCYR